MGRQKCTCIIYIYIYILTIWKCRQYLGKENVLVVRLTFAKIKLLFKDSDHIHEVYIYPTIFKKGIQSVH